MLNYFALPATGFFVGLLVIAVGGGGGAFYMGILTAFFNIPPAVAVSTSLATIIPTTATGSFSHWRAGNVNVRFGLTMLAGGVIGSIVGSLCSSLLPQSLYNRLTGVIMLFLSARMFVVYLRKKRGKVGDAGHTDGEKKKSDVVKAVAFGFLGGAISGLIGLSGGGPIIAGLAIMGCGALETVGTSVLVLLGISITGFTMHLGLGSVQWKLVGLLIIGTMSGAFVGPILLKRIDREKMEKVLQPVLLIMMVLIGVILLFK
jgi:uncharacterized protein